MASITYDGQSFMIDGRRIWIVGGAIHYARVPRSLWPARIQAARAAGLNTVATPVFWARHEPRQGQFDFKGDNDIRHFVQLVHQHGMYCILRPGPFINSAWDLGGLPSWVQSVANIKLRTANAPFLEASSRYITALAQQVRDLQVTSAGEGGPILLVQNEHAWTCGNDELAGAYLGELSRYFREAGLTVPIINANDLWQTVEGEIDCWSGEANMLADLRQLAAVRPDQPRVVIDFRTGHPDVWGRPAARPAPPGTLVRRLAEVLAGAGQFNLSPFHGGTNFGFSAGRLATGPAEFVATSFDCGAPVSEAGTFSPAYDAVKRIATFSSRFARVLANLDPSRHTVAVHPAAPAPGGGAKGAAAAPPSVVHVFGAQGSVAFVFADDPSQPKGTPGPSTVNLLLPDGSTLPVPLGGESVVWCLFDTRLTGRTTLDWCNLSAFAVVGRTLACFGPAGARGQLSINGSRLEVEVPGEGSHDPAVVEHEGIAVVVCSTGQIDAAFADDEAVYVGLAAMERGAGGAAVAVPHHEYKHYTRVSATGEVTTHKIGSGKGSTPARRRHNGARVALGHWTAAPAAEYAEGTSARFASIPGPADLDSLGAPAGYGWYRIRFKAPQGGRHRLLLHNMRDRAQLILDGEPVGVAGAGPGAEAIGHLSMRKKPHTLVVLAENFGRPAGGLHLAQPVGLAGHIWSVSPLKVKAPKVETGDPVDAMAVHSPFWLLHRGETTEASRLTWHFPHRRKTPVFISIGDTGGTRGIVLLNDQPVRAFDSAGVQGLMLDAEALSRGNNSVQLALVGPPGYTAAHASALAHAVSFHEGEECLTDKGERVEWAFAKWEAPGPDAFHRAGKGAEGSPGAVAGPCWWSCQFTPDESDAPLLLDLTGLSKGQVYVNGRHLGRYFVATAAGEPVPPQSRYFLPRSMLEPGRPNDLLIFDEHGFSPARASLVTHE